MKYLKYLLLIPIIFVIVIILLLHFNNSYKKISTLNISKINIDSMSEKLTESIESLDSLKPAVEATIKKIKYYENLKRDYQNQVAEKMYIPVYDTGLLNDLKRKLATANSEIFRLKNELATIQGRKPEKEIEYIKPEIEIPDENSILISLDRSSLKGTIQDKLIIYLIPYTKEVKRFMQYESSCNQELTGNQTAKYYNGYYFFNSVPEGKYLIKICTYYGNYKLINKKIGQYALTMQIAPPLQ